MSDQWQQGLYTGPGKETEHGWRAGFWSRVGAYLVDSLLVGAVAGVAQLELKGVGIAIGFAFSIVYFVYCWAGRRGQTLGMAGLGIRVIDSTDGEELGYEAAALRWVGQFLCGLALGLGFLWMLWDSNSRTWADMIGGSVVVPVWAYPLD